MCENIVTEFINGHQIQIKCGYVFINHLGNLEIARCSKCEHKPRFLHDFVRSVADKNTI